MGHDDAAADAKTKKPRILIADDEPNLRLLYKSELESEGFDVLLATNGREAISVAASERPDLVVLDIRMPGMDGVEVLQRILDHNRTMPVILNSAYSSYKENFMTWAADAYVVKSSDVTELIAKIRDVLGKRKGERGGQAGSGAGG
ncbi:MAG: response regulator [Planctomycetes bacterium]|nr:response regulator [Planctomycetota bacterium]